MTGRRSGWIAWSGISFAGLSLLLVVVNVALAVVNARTQAEVTARQQFIADGPQYNQIGEALVHSLNAAATATNDGALIAMMQRHGLNPSGAAAAPTPGRRTR
ncbi:MAG: hypothetical protein KGL11_00250 [Alphaproteobacteria bacterium]|nr:hypothetical protein [Alphaproteobacteria bacterium]